MVAPLTASASRSLTSPPTKQLRTTSSAAFCATMAPPSLLMMRPLSTHAWPPSTSTPGFIVETLPETWMPSISTVASPTVSCGEPPPERIQRGSSPSFARNARVRAPSTVVASSRLPLPWMMIVPSVPMSKLATASPMVGNSCPGPACTTLPMPDGRHAPVKRLQAASPHWSCSEHGTQVLLASSHTGVVPMHASGATAVHCTHAPPTHTGIVGSSAAHAPSGSSIASHATHSPLAGSQKGASASGQSSLPRHGIGPVVLLELSLPLSDDASVPGSVVELDEPPIRHESSTASVLSPPQGL